MHTFFVVPEGLEKQRAQEFLQKQLIALIQPQKPNPVTSAIHASGLTVQVLSISMNSTLLQTIL
jgi:hypothetical protein